MEDDIDLGSLIPLRDAAKALVDLCQDADLLDLICRLILHG